MKKKRTTQPVKAYTVRVFYDGSGLEDFARKIGENEVVLSSDFPNPYKGFLYIPLEYVHIFPKNVNGFCGYVVAHHRQ